MWARQHPLGLAVLRRAWAILAAYGEAIKRGVWHWLILHHIRWDHWQSEIFAVCRILLIHSQIWSLNCAYVPLSRAWKGWCKITHFWLNDLILQTLVVLVRHNILIQFIGLWSTEITAERWRTYVVRVGAELILIIDIINIKIVVVCVRLDYFPLSTADNPEEAPASPPQSSESL